MLSLIINLLWIFCISFIFGFALFLVWKFLDLKYFSQFEISQLRAENEYLKEENKKFKGASSEFWKE